MIYLYRFPPEIKIETNNGRTNFSCFAYKRSVYCCKNSYWLLITDINVSDDITDDNISITDCYQHKKEK